MKGIEEYVEQRLTRKLADLMREGEAASGYRDREDERERDARGVTVLGSKVLVHTVGGEQ
jgi:hypothetical protein